MTERPNFQEEYMKDIPMGTPLDKAIELTSTPPKFKSLLGYLQGEVKIESLLEDRVSQARLDTLLDVYSKRVDYSRTLQSPSDLPVVTLKGKREKRKGQNDEDVLLGPTKAIEHCRFQLNDGEYLYYFSTRQPEDASKYLRDQDVVPVEEYEDWRRDIAQPFMKPISRVPLGKEESAESYNYNTGAWEANKQGYAYWENPRDVRGV
jgi:hypothetical protein